MTREDKAAKIRAYCDARDITGERCDGCVLCDFEERGCFESIAEDWVIDRNYAVLFGEPEEDPVNHASHYNNGAIECIDAIAASMTPTEYAGFLKGQVLKYVWRYRLKGKPVEDLKKAGYYLDRLIRITEREEEKKND